LYFHLHRTNIANIPNHVHKNSPFYGQQVHFSVPVHGNGRFSGQEKKKTTAERISGRRTSNLLAVGDRLTCEISELPVSMGLGIGIRYFVFT
jgi:hypothetical protein